MGPDTDRQLLGETRRQIEICNACRYCEGYCAVFPAIARSMDFSDGDLVQLANLCHNCRGCFYACQYAPPHDFAVNLPRVLAEVRTESWDRYAWPAGLAGRFQRSALAITLALVCTLAVMILAVAFLPGTGQGFYGWLGHGAMVAIFGPAFLLPLLAISIGVRRFWRESGGTKVAMADIARALSSTARLKNLSGGQDQGCNFEREDRYSDARRRAHQAAMYGFALCFLATCVGTLMHYGAAWPAPYPWWTPPKLLGISGGILLVTGCTGLAWLKTRADVELGAPDAWGGEMAFVVLLGLTGLSGLALFAAAGTSSVGVLLALHLASVLALFLLAPYSKMAHGAYRFAALVRDAQEKATAERTGDTAPE